MLSFPKLIVPVLEAERLLNNKAKIVTTRQLDCLTHDGGQLRTVSIGIHSPNHFAISPVIGQPLRRR